MLQNILRSASRLWDDIAFLGKGSYSTEKGRIFCLNKRLTRSIIPLDTPNNLCVKLKRKTFPLRLPVKRREE